MKIVFWALVLFPSLFCVSQDRRIKNISDDSSIAKWNRSVIALESIQSPSDKLIKYYYEQYNNGEITSERLLTIEDSLANNAERSWGTAIFIKYNGKHFLLSARHVFADNVNDTNGICGKLILVENIAGIPNDTSNQLFIESGEAKKAKDFPVEIIKTNAPDRVVLRNALIENGAAEVRALHINWPNQYLLSSRSDDIGLIALDNVCRGKRFMQTLYKRGYVPIEIGDIDTACSLNRLDSVYCIGYPLTSIEEQHPSSAARAAYIANIKVVNFISKGFVYKSSTNSNFFEAAMFTYHGFSGGPVIRNNKLIGIVNGATYEEVRRDNDQAIKTFVVYHSKFVKSSLIYKYLKYLGSYDEKW